MIHRVILIVLLLLGLAIGICGGVEQAGLGRSIYLVSEAVETVDAKPVASKLGEAWQTLDSCFNLTTTSMYLGLAIVLVAIIGLSLQEKRKSSVGQ